MTIKLERRGLPMEFRVKQEEDKPPVLEGYGAVFDKLSEELWGFREKISKGAFKETIGRDDIRFLFNHNADHVLGRNTAGTLELNEDENGLRFEVQLPDTQFARDLAVSVERRDIDQCSFGFLVDKDVWDYTDDDMPIRTLEQVSLFDVSLVTYPAYTDTAASVRSMQDTFEEHMADLKEQKRQKPAISMLKRKLDLLEMDN